MRLLDVEAVLNRDTDTQGVEHELEILKELDDKTTSYAILSHRWGTGTEVTYKEMTGLMKMEGQKGNEVKRRDGYRKIIKSCEQAMKDGHKWLWIDTCCIDKRSSSELSEAINSMYRWYQNSQVCYAYLSDVDEPTFPTKPNYSKFSNSNGWPEWFIRGWTLQELIAPREVKFLNGVWAPIGNKGDLADTLQEVTRIPLKVLTNGLTSVRPSIAQVMSWAADRKTTRVEDRAYSLLGLFGVNMPMLYGEREKAFQRLQLEIIRQSSDHSIFAWDPKGRIQRTGSVLADDPSYFQDCHDITKVETDRFVDELVRYAHRHGLGNFADKMHKLVALRNAVRSQRLSKFSVTNVGIKVRLPVVPYLASPTSFKVVLACSDCRENLITIDLACYGSTTSDRSFHTTEIRKIYPEIRTLYLTYSQDLDETRHVLVLDDATALNRGFTRCGIFPREITGDTVTLSSITQNLVIVVYTDGRSRFAVVLGLYFSQGWVHLTYDEHPAAEYWADFAKKTYDVMADARADYARSLMRKPGKGNKGRRDDVFVKHAHLPQTILAAIVAWGRWETGNLKVVVGVETCPGCCIGPRQWRLKSDDQNRDYERKVEQFERIREHFHTLVNLPQPQRTGIYDKPSNRQAVTEAIQLFSDTFGVKYLQDYVGEITFLRKLPLIVEAESSLAGVARGDRLLERLPFVNWAVTRNPSNNRCQSAAQDQCVEVELPVLRKRCHALYPSVNETRGYVLEERKVELEVNSVSQTLGATLLRHIGIAFKDAYHNHSRRRPQIDQTNGDLNFNRHADVSSMVHEIQGLQAMHNAIEDEDEKRALGEDITGKILWICWCGICSEVERLLPKAS